MINSLYKLDKKINFFVLAIDKKTFEKISTLKLDFIYVININDFFKRYPELKKQQKKRKINEFCFLLTPFLIEYCFTRFKKKRIFYTDADLFFFDKCNAITNKLNKFSIISSVHNFSLKNKFQEKINGIYNVGFLGFKKDNVGKKCINIWKKQCLFSTTLNESFNGIIKGDQLYLNKWPKIFKKKFYGITDKLFNIGAWNINDHKFYYKKNIIYSDKKKLKMLHANFIEFQNNEIILINKKNMRIINNVIYKNYLTTSENYGIKKFNLYKINILRKMITYILKIISFYSKAKPNRKKLNNSKYHLSSYKYYSIK
jgi:hypothetical protein